MVAVNEFAEPVNLLFGDAEGAIRLCLRHEAARRGCGVDPVAREQLRALLAKRRPISRLRLFPLLGALLVVGAQARRRVAQGHLHYGCGYPVIGRVLYPPAERIRAIGRSVKRENGNKYVIDNDIEYRNNECADQQAQGNIFPGINHLSGDKGHIVPGIGRKESPDKGDANSRNKRKTL